MRTCPALVLCLALVAAVPGAEPALTPPKTFDLPALDAYVARMVREKGYVGLALGIVRDGQLVLDRGYGKSSLENGTPVTPETRFAIGSVTKQFTCACIFLLAEEGKLSVRDPVAKYYPNLTRSRDITLYDLMTHAAGYPDYYPLDFVDRRMARPIPLEGLLREYAGGPLDFEPGSRWSYSNTGYILLGRIVEKVSGEPFGQFLTRRILKPLGMDQTVFEPAAGAGRLARGYTSIALGPPEPAVPEGPGWIHAAGGLYSTAADLAKWDLALVGGKVLKPESYRLMTAPRELADGRTKNYGCGLGVVQRDGETLLRHTGGVSGFLAYNTVLPRTKSAVILLTNGDYLDAASLHGEIVTLLLRDQAGRERELPRVQGPSARDTALDLLRQMQAGTIDRSKLGAEFNHYLSDERLRTAAPRLKALGAPTRVDVDDTWERGGMEVSLIRFTFPSGPVKALLYRKPDGTIEQFLLQRG